MVCASVQSDSFKQLHHQERRHHPGNWCQSQSYLSECSASETFLRDPVSPPLLENMTTARLSYHAVLKKGKAGKVGSSPFVIGWTVCSPNILRTVQWTIICFLIEILLGQTWFERFDELRFVLNPLGHRPPVTAHSFSLPHDPRPPSRGRLADAPD